MLPQGYSDRLSARISQQVDVDWGNSVHQLTDIMDNAVPAKVFSDQSILCVGADMVPQPKGKRVRCRTICNLSSSDVNSLLERMKRHKRQVIRLRESLCAWVPIASKPSPN